MFTDIKEIMIKEIKEGIMPQIENINKDRDYFLKRINRNYGVKKINVMRTITKGPQQI